MNIYIYIIKECNKIFFLVGCVLWTKLFNFQLGSIWCEYFLFFGIRIRGTFDTHRCRYRIYIYNIQVCVDSDIQCDIFNIAYLIFPKCSGVRSLQKSYFVLHKIVVLVLAFFLHICQDFNLIS